VSDRPAARIVLVQMEAPTNLAATVHSQTEIDLSWTNNSPDANGIEIDRKIGANGTYAVRALLMGANISSYADRTLISNTTYSYRVRAISATRDADAG